MNLTYPWGSCPRIKYAQSFRCSSVTFRLFLSAMSIIKNRLVLLPDRKYFFPIGCSIFRSEFHDRNWSDSWAGMCPPNRNLLLSMIDSFVRLSTYATRLPSLLQLISSIALSMSMSSELKTVVERVIARFHNRARHGVWPHAMRHCTISVPESVKFFTTYFRESIRICGDGRGDVI